MRAEDEDKNKRRRKKELCNAMRLRQNSQFAVLHEIQSLTHCIMVVLFSEFDQLKYQYQTA